MDKQEILNKIVVLQNRIFMEKMKESDYSDDVVCDLQAQIRELEMLAENE